MHKRIAIIGGGAAGCFAAISAKELDKTVDVVLFESQSSLLEKVKLTGGGRCNLTNTFECVSSKLTDVYPRGDKLLRKLFSRFGPKETYGWFVSHGLPLYSQEDQRVFPQSNQSMSVINTLIACLKEEGVNVRTRCRVKSLSQKSDGSWLLEFGEDQSDTFDAVVVAMGGKPNTNSFSVFERLGHDIESCVPSLFSFNIRKSVLRELMGTVADNVVLGILGTKLRSSGSLLLTHWGMSGPAVLRLSSYGARYVANKDYRFDVSVDWTGMSSPDKVRDMLLNYAVQHAAERIIVAPLFGLPKRLRNYLFTELSLPLDRRWDELGKKGINRLTEKLTHDVYAVDGRTVFKEEFVTCGGISLRSVSSKTLESKHASGLFFAGESLDVDAVTGGFNLQAAWTTGFIAGEEAVRSVSNNK